MQQSLKRLLTIALLITTAHAESITALCTNEPESYEVQRAAPEGTADQALTLSAAALKNWDLLQQIVADSEFKNHGKSATLYKAWESANRDLRNQASALFVFKEMAGTEYSNCGFVFADFLTFQEYYATALALGKEGKDDLTMINKTKALLPTSHE